MIPTKAKLKTYKSAILPHLTYCQTVRHFCCPSDVRKVERVRERGLRVANLSKSSSYEELSPMAKLTTLGNHPLQEIAIIMYKVRNNIAPSYIAKLFTKNVSRYALRNADFTKPEFSKMTHAKHSLNLGLNSGQS